MQNIRRALAQDIPYIYEIALKTAMAGLDGSDHYHDKFLVGHYWAAPYFFFEPELCFVAINEIGRPAGYIVGTSDTRLFNDWMQQVWLPPLQLHYRSQTTFKSEAEHAVAKTLLKGPGEGLWQNLGYPAHLHIDLLEELQGKGLGRSLMQTFIQRAKDQGAEGIHLGVDGRNVRAFGFYERMGFTILETQSWGSTFGLKLT
ncbi:MAG: GNAT family N-acetyltransferase [Sphaerochaeta sp.]|jgi:ribosomal protein S18 acetylase RimI-like enzyme|nr:GNAT family N-acetyltransferase [Sphaerochaeta sp.]MDX9914689.1 GNAT family N-acetyltransferase [Sphaerochaeta sp.]